ncbi:MAG TPA: NADP-dependent oxidoreductase [Chthoniobacterales bacterium]|nr:NADP-dependent oxidoreductase [Chthoniobacterales bacterium]
MATKNRQILLARRPTGQPSEADFSFSEATLGDPQPGQMLLRTLWLSLDPYMRGRMSDRKSYAAPVGIGDVMVGGTVSEVVASQLEGFVSGDIVEGRTGWQEYALSDGVGMRKVDPALGPISTALGVLGMPGMTAYFGLFNIGKPKPGETVVVSAAAGAVGAIVGQLAKIKGCRVVGVAGAPEKCAYVVNELGFDECVSHREPDLTQRLEKACPKGIDVYFENVGGRVFEAVLPWLNDFARVPVCGLIAHYNDTELPSEPNQVPLLMRAILTRRLTVRGFIRGDFLDQQAAFFEDMSRWIRENRIKYREDIVEGLENAPRAFLKLFRGENFGKLLVKVAKA